MGTASSSLTSTAGWDKFGSSTSVSGKRGTRSDEDWDRWQSDLEFLEGARERFRVSVIAESNRRQQMLIDAKFAAGKQWDEWVELQRRQQGRPCLTLNRIPGFLNHVLNNMRQERPGIKVDPVGDGADEEIAEIRQGIIRHIEMISRAELAYDKAFENECITGLGYVRVVDGWADYRSMDQELYIQWVPNQFTVYEDPSAHRPDWTDGKYKFIVEDISIEEYRLRFGTNKEAASAENFQSTGDHAPFWFPNGKVRLAEYWYVEEESDQACKLADGTEILMSEIAEQHEGDPVDQWPEIVSSRPTKVPRVKWALITGLDVIKRRNWKGKFIPVIPFIGNQTELDGERLIFGMVRFAREAQRMYNYMYTSFVEIVALAPKAPWVAEFNQIQEFRNQYEMANTQPQAVLPYNNVSADNGAPLGPPQRQTFEPPIQAFVVGLKMCDDMLKSTFSIYDASLGEKGPQESGLAINSRKIESDLATFNWIDNFSKGLVLLGIVLDDLLPFYYNNPGKIIRIIQEDLTQRTVTMNQPTIVKGQQKIYDLTKGKFAISYSSGPGLPTRRQEASKAMLELAKVYPPLMQVAGPTVVRSMDWPDKDVIAAQMEKAQPPELRQQPDGAGIPSKPEDQQQIAQLSQMVQALSKLLGAATDKSQLQTQKEIWETFRTQMMSEVQLITAEMKANPAMAQNIANKAFEEMERVRQATETMLAAQQVHLQQAQAAQQQQPAPSSAAPGASAAAPPQAPMAPQPVPTGQPAGIPQGG